VLTPAFAGDFFMSRKILYSVALFLFTSYRAVFCQDATTHTKDSLQTVKDNVKSGKAVIVEVREQGEWDAGHVKVAILAPMSKLRREAEAKELLKLVPKDKIVYTHCKAGGRALMCGDILKANGYDVRPLKPGYEDLIQAGFEKAP
jgi:rhodanese-related sulfurtransferase